jgi:hypothetical protein
MEVDKEPSLQDMFEYLVRRDGRGDLYDQLLAQKTAEDDAWHAKVRNRWAMEWVGGHPAMMRKALQTDPDLPVWVVPKDILNAPNGPPPSRRAVTTLVNWVNRPQKFHEQMIGIHKRAEFVGSDAASKDEDEDLSLQEVRELIKQFACGKRPSWS